jgi:hypothetical protein
MNRRCRDAVATTRARSKEGGEERKTRRYKNKLFYPSKPQRNLCVAILCVPFQQCSPAPILTHIGGSTRDVQGYNIVVVDVRLTKRSLRIGLLGGSPRSRCTSKRAASTSSATFSARVEAV